MGGLGSIYRLPTSVLRVVVARYGSVVVVEGARQSNGLKGKKEDLSNGYTLQQRSAIGTATDDGWIDMYEVCYMVS